MRPGGQSTTTGQTGFDFCFLVRDKETSDQSFQGLGERKGAESQEYQYDVAIGHGLGCVHLTSCSRNCHCKGHLLEDACNRIVVQCDGLQPASFHPT